MSKNLCRSDIRQQLKDLRVTVGAKLLEAEETNDVHRAALLLEDVIALDRALLAYRDFDLRRALKGELAT